jgi:DNA-binding PadR family transcriptional regulator
MTDPSLLILSSLAHGDKHGHAMILDIEDFAGVRLGPGTLYGAITRLEDRGLIRPLPSSDRRQPYRITAEGRTYLRDELMGLAQLASTGLGRLRNA